MGNPVMDRVAILSVATTPYLRDAGGMSAAALACKASSDAIVAAGIDRASIDGIAGSSVPTTVVQASLGLPGVTWWSNESAPFGLIFTAAVNAIFAGSCTTALVYHSTYRGSGASASAASDPFRRGNPSDPHGHNVGMMAETPSGTFGYCAWAQRYLHQFGQSREVFGRVAINGRSNASRNDHALFRNPLSMDEYLAGRMIREPLCIYDMDPPVDAGDAFIITSTERARDLCSDPVVVHAATFGRTAKPFADQLEGYDKSGKEIVARDLWAKSDIGLSEIDLFYPYDGFSIMAVGWIEALGYCGTGEAGDFLHDHWDRPSQRILIDGRVPVNTHGGSLSEGATQGAGHMREAYQQLKGTVGERQVEGAATALVTSGGFMWNATGMVLRR